MSYYTLRRTIREALAPTSTEAAGYVTEREAKGIVAEASNGPLTPGKRRLLGELIEHARASLDTFGAGRAPNPKFSTGETYLEGWGVRHGLIGATRVLNDFAVEGNLELGPKHLGALFAQTRKERLGGKTFNVHRGSELTFEESASIGNFDKSTQTWKSSGVTSWTPEEALAVSTTQAGSYIAFGSEGGGARLLTSLRVSNDAVPGTIITVRTRRGPDFKIQVT